MAGFPYYYIDIVGSPDDFQFVLKAPNGQIVNTLENSKQIAQKIKDQAYNFVYQYYGTLSARTSFFEDGNSLIYSFYKVVFPILLEQYLSALYESKGIRIQYPNINFYLATLYKFYKILSNPRSTLNFQEFAMLISPLIGKVSWGNSSYDLIILFDSFVNTYYKVLNYKKKVRIGMNPYMNFGLYFK
jgi:hypothetical protein